MSQQRSKAAAQLWDALKESKCLADSLKVPWRAEEACQQLAELLESVTSLLSHVFGRYRDSLFMGALNIHLQSSGTADCVQLVLGQLLSVERCNTCFKSITAVLKMVIAPSSDVLDFANRKRGILKGVS